MKQDIIVILDLGSTKNTDLARAIRAMGVYTEIHAHDITLEKLKAIENLKGVILYGGQNNIVDGKKIDISEELLTSGVPFIAIDYDFKGIEKTTADNIADFVFNVCKCEKNWNIENFIQDQVELIKKQVGDKKVLLALSGGVDSSVVAALLIKAIGDNLICVHVNHGLLRRGEAEQVIEVFERGFGIKLIYIDATERYLKKLKGVSNSEKKRLIIGKEFIKIFAEEAKKLNGVEFLGQGTIYPDIIESGTKTVKAVKPHHNVGGLPKSLNFELVEPLKFLFKDEVRACGKALGLPEEMVERQPFPGPGLGVRCLGAITRDRLEAVRHSDAILREEFKNAKLDKKVWQYFTLIPDVKSTGVDKNGNKFIGYPVIIRAVNTVDAMTATVEHIDYAILDKIVNRITSEVKGVNRVCVDLTPKPTGTIEWE